MLAALPGTAVAQADGNGITAPAADATVRGTVRVQGVAADRAFRKWQLDFLVDGDDQQADFLALGEEAVSTPADLFALDTTRYSDGRHALRLRVVRRDMNYAEYVTPLIVANRNPVTATHPSVAGASPITAVVAGSTQFCYALPEPYKHWPAVIETADKLGTPCWLNWYTAPVFLEDPRHTPMVFNAQYRPSARDLAAWSTAHPGRTWLLWNEPEIAAHGSAHWTAGGNGMLNTAPACR